MTQTTPRLALPCLAAGQAQKELFHNEALTRIDLALGAAVVAAGLDVPPATPEPGQCWIVGPQPAAAWAGQAKALAGWTEGGWRFVAPTAGMAVWHIGDNVQLVYDGVAWRRGELRGDRVLVGGKQVVGARQPAIAGAAGGTVIDAEARTALARVIAMLRAHGLTD